MKTQSNQTTAKEKPDSYTPQGEHPEDRIFKDGDFIRELAKVQDLYFEKLVSDLRLNEEGKDWLFDYIHNEDDRSISFDEYLSKFGVSYEDCLVSKAKEAKKAKKKPSENFPSL